MKRVGHLFESVTSFENLFMAARLARRGCGNTPSACRFWFYLEPELLRLQRELREGTYQPQPYRYFMIHDPKERMIAVAPFRDRVAHHAIVRVLTPVYEPRFISDSYATRPGKGHHAAIQRAQQFARRWTYFLKTDLAKYFDSVDHSILMEIVRRTIKDAELLRLIEIIIRNASRSGLGLPIGNLTSQFFANVYLNPFDHLVKEEWRLRGYLRYMDDMLFFSDRKDDLLALRSRMAAWLDDHLRLRLKDRATHLDVSRQGMTYLGMRIFPQTFRIQPINFRRSLRRLKQAHAAWQRGEIADDALQQRVSSLSGHLRYFCPHLRLPLFEGDTARRRA